MDKNRRQRLDGEREKGRQLGHDAAFNVLAGTD
jgi:hypothetical protein